MDDPKGTDMFTAYAEIATDLVVNIAAIFLLAYVLYFRRHRRADLLLAYVALNIGIFVAISLLTTVRVDIALGFGLFAILSIIRLRSTSVTQQEVAYYFVALVMGLVNGMDIPDRRLVVLINVLLLGAMAIVDSKGLRERTRRMDVHLDVVHADDASLVADLERRLGGTVLHHEVNDVDYVRQTMLVDVRYRAGTHPVVAPVDERAAGRHAGRGPRRRRGAGRRPGAPAGRAGAAPPGQGHRLRARHDGGRGDLPRLDAGRPPAPRHAAPATGTTPTTARSTAPRSSTGRSTGRSTDT